MTDLLFMLASVAGDNLPAVVIGVAYCAQWLRIENRLTKLETLIKTNANTRTGDTEND